MTDAPPLRASWVTWDGARLRWRIDSDSAQSQTVELRLDGVTFERIASAPGEYERDFHYSPSGNAQLEFSLCTADGWTLAPAWRVLAGRTAIVGADEWSGGKPVLQALADMALPPMTMESEARAVAIIVPIFNSPELVRRCIEAVLRWTRNCRLILIDDASNDAEIAPLLAGYAKRADIDVRTNSQNLGYTRSCNIGIELAGTTDVVLLNSDTEVGPRWLERLDLTAYADAHIGTVTAVSDNAGAFTVPDLEQYCPVPREWDLVQTQRAMLHNNGACLPELPTGNGFCMYVKRALLDQIGVLDADAFPAGYGEENDLCQRAASVGFRHVIAGDVFVRHARSASFGEERRRTLGAAGMAVLRSRYPRYEADVGATLFSYARRVLDYRVRRLYVQAPYARAPRPRVLLVGQNPDAADRLPHYECFRSDAGHNLETWRAWLVRLAIEAIYVADGAIFSADLRTAAQSGQVPIVRSLEELTAVAPTGGVP
jgi:GT2 family glycosyltransferase